MEAVAVRSETSINAAQTVVLATEEIVEAQPVLKLRLKKPKGDKKVEWREGTIDNEHMGKKKSKCCCIYKKPVAFGESSSEDDEECEHCFGHPEKRKKNRKQGDADATHEHEHEHEHQHDDNATCSIRGHHSDPTPVAQ